MGTAPQTSRGRASTDNDSSAPAADRPHRIVVVDDHHLVRLAIGTLLEGEDDLEVVAEADSLESARNVLSRPSDD